MIILSIAMRFVRKAEVSVPSITLIIEKNIQVRQTSFKTTVFSIKFGGSSPSTRIYLLTVFVTYCDKFVKLPSSRFFQQRRGSFTLSGGRGFFNLSERKSFFNLSLSLERRFLKSRRYQ